MCGISVGRCYLKVSQLKWISSMSQQNMFLINLSRMLQAVNMPHSHAFAVEPEKRCWRFAPLAEFLKKNKHFLFPIFVFPWFWGIFFSGFLFAFRCIFMAVSLFRLLWELVCQIIKGSFTTECINIHKMWCNILIKQLIFSWLKTGDQKLRQAVMWKPKIFFFEGRDYIDSQFNEDSMINFVMKFWLWTAAQFIADTYIIILWCLHMYTLHYWEYKVKNTIMIKWKNLNYLCKYNSATLCVTENNNVEERERFRPVSL